MTEAEWLACDDPQQMLVALRQGRHKGDVRKKRLFGCACCRHVPAVIEAAGVLSVIEAVERFADGLMTVEAFSRCWPGPDIVNDLTPRRTERLRSTCASLSADGVAEQAYHVELLKDIFDISRNGPTVLRLPANWRTETVMLLARQMYESRDFGAMPILADALQDAGCDNEDVLNHCRSNSVHVRGCWVVDRILDKG